MLNNIKAFKHLYFLFNRLRSYYDKIPSSITEEDYEKSFEYLSKLKEFRGVGINCYYVANLRKLNFWDVGGSTVQLIGYEAEKIKNKNFAFGLKIFPLDNILEVIKGMIDYHQYVSNSDVSVRLNIKGSIIINVKPKFGKVFKGLLQSAPLILDEKGNIAAMYTSITDISHFGLPKELVKVDIVDESDPDNIILVNVVNKNKSSTIITNAELRILKLLNSGKSTKEIAEILSLSTHTISTHRKNMLLKLNVKNTPELISKTIQLL